MWDVLIHIGPLLVLPCTSEVRCSASIQQLPVFILYGHYRITRALVQSLCQEMQGVPRLHVSWYAVNVHFVNHVCHMEQMMGSVRLYLLSVQLLTWDRTLTKEANKEGVGLCALENWNSIH